MPASTPLEDTGARAVVAEAGADDDRVGPGTDVACDGVVVRGPRGAERLRFGFLHRRHALVRDDELHHPDAASHRRSRGEDARARHAASAADDRQLLSSSLVRVPRNRRQLTRRPSASSTSCGVREYGVDRRTGESDIEHDDGAACFAIHEMAALDRAEREREVGARDFAGCFAGRRIHSARHVDGDDPRTSRASRFAFGDRLRDRRRAAHRSSRCRAVRRRRAIRRRRAAGSNRRQRSAPSSSRARARSERQSGEAAANGFDDSHRNAGRVQRARDDPRVAAVVARPGEDENAGVEAISESERDFRRRPRRRRVA